MVHSRVPQGLKLNTAVQRSSECHNLGYPSSEDNLPRHPQSQRWSGPRKTRGTKPYKLVLSRLRSVDHNVLQKIHVWSDTHNLEFSSIKNALMFECRNSASFECQGPTQTMVLQRKFSDKPAAQITQSLPEPHKTFGTAQSAVNKRPDKAAMINELLIVPNGGRACFQRSRTGWFYLVSTFNWNSLHKSIAHQSPDPRCSFFGRIAKNKYFEAATICASANVLFKFSKGGTKGGAQRFHVFSCVFQCRALRHCRV